MAFIVLDTETADRFKRQTDQPEPWNSLVYDIGWLVVDGSEVLKRRSFAVAETITNTALMQSAYYADKLPAYHEGIGATDGAKWKIASFLDIWRTFKSDCKEYDVRQIWAYNCSFDMQALNSTMRAYSNGFAPFFTPYKCIWRDIWDYSSCITGTRPYVRWAETHGYISERGNPQTSAECVYRYLKHDTAFIEDHTALSDATIELEILLAVRRRKKKTRHSKGMGWKAAADIYKTL